MAKVTESRIQMFTLFAGRHVRWCPLEAHQHGGSILGSVNLCDIFRQIFEDIGKTYKPKTWISVFIIYLLQHYNFLSLFTEWFSNYIDIFIS